MTMRSQREAIAGWSTTGAMVAMAVANLFQRMAEGVEMEAMLIVYWLLLAALGALTATRKWWAYALAAFFAVQALFLTVLGGLPVALKDLGHPAFPAALIFVILALVATVAGSWSAWNARRAKAAQRGGA